MGVPVEAAEGGMAPLKLDSRPAGSRLRALDYHLPVASAQVKTAILLAGLNADGLTRIWEPHRSRDHTERLLGSMGAEISFLARESGQSSTGVSIAPLDSALSPIQITIPGDFSSAAFLIVAALITPGSEITIRKVGLNPTRTGLLRVLKRMGGQIELLEEGMQGGEPFGDLVVKHSRLQSAGISGPAIVEMIDEVPAFGVACAYGSGRSEARDAEELRLKESDRIASLCIELVAMGGRVREMPDGFEVTGSEPLQGGIVQPHGDHRLEMALAVAGLAARQPTRIQDAGLFTESYPGFVEDLCSLGADIQTG
jgi:3-phosphoshikimate 1-carboxyvinyltransferase